MKLLFSTVTIMHASTTYTSEKMPLTPTIKPFKFAIHEQATSPFILDPQWTNKINNQKITPLTPLTINPETIEKNSPKKKMIEFLSHRAIIAAKKHSSWSF
jgi:hypothetical protein